MADVYSPGDRVRILIDVPEGIQVNFYEVVEPARVEESQVLVLHSRQSGSDDAISISLYGRDIGSDGVVVLSDKMIMEHDHDHLYEELGHNSLIRAEDIASDYHFSDDQSAEEGEGHGHAF